VPELLKKLDESATNLRAITDKADALMVKTNTFMGKTDALVSENRKNIDAMLESFREMAKNLKETTDDVKSHPWKLLRKP